MSLKTSILLKNSYDWKSINLTDNTGSGITGYGTNQNPLGHREINNVVAGKIVITDRDSNAWTLDKTLLEMQNIISNGLTIYPSNIGLGNSPDTQFYDTIFSVLYIPFLTNDAGITINATVGSKIVSYNDTATPGEIYWFTNVTHLRSEVTGNVYQVSSIDTKTKIITLTTPWTDSGGIITGDDYSVGIATTSYIAISQAIKTCLENRIVDMTSGNCKCEAVDIMHQALMYDAMNLNLAQANQTRGYQMYDWLTTKCEQDCGCY